MSASIDAALDENESATAIDPNDIAEQWRSIMEALVPPTKVTVEDVAGYEHQLRCMLPATVEIRLMGILEKLLDLPVVHGRAAAIANADRGVDAIGKIVSAVTGIASDPQVLKILSDGFKLAHPRAVREAVAHVAADEDLMVMLDIGDPSGLEPMHLFSIADIVGGMVPFGVRGVAKGKLLMQGFAPPRT